MKKLFTLVCVLVCWSGIVSAQTVTAYTFAASSGAYSTISGTSPSRTGGTADDGYYNTLPIGFNFIYGGNTYTTFSASTNGWLTLGQSISTAIYAWNTNDMANSGGQNAPRPIIAPLWDDLTIGTLTYSTTGSTPNRICTIQFASMIWYYNASSASVSYQVRLYEGSNKIEFVYTQLAGAVQNSPSASIGITGGAGSSVTGAVSYLSLNSTGTSPTVSSSTETTNLSTRPASNQVYAFAPPPFVSAPSTTLAFGSVAAGSTSTQQSFLLNGSSLTANVTVTAPTGYEVSLTSGSGFGGSVVVPYSASNFYLDVPIYVRFAPGSVATFNSNVTISGGGATTVNVPVTGNGICGNPNITNFTSPSATSQCSNTAGTVTVNSTSLGAGTFTVTYNLTGANASSGNTATLTMGATNGTFTIPAGQLANGGSTTVTITNIARASCNSAVSTNNTAAFTVIAPNISNFTSPTAAAVCMGGASTITVNSTSLGAGTFTVTYNLTGTNTATGNTATLTMGAANGTFTTSTLANSGSTTVTITGISASGCSTTVSSSNTVAFTVNTLPTVGSITPSVATLCTGGSLVLTAGATSGTGSLVSYSWSGPNSYSAVIAGPTNTASLTPAATAASGIYSVRVTYSAPGCVSNAATSSSITVNSAPTLANASNSGPICAGGTLLLGVNTPLNVTGYAWSGPVSITGAATASASVPSASTGASGTYSVVVNNGAGPGCTATYTTAAVVNAAPSLASATNGGPICEGNTLTLTANGPSNVTSYAWTGPTAITNATSASASVPAATAATASGIYTVTVSNGAGAGCSVNYTTTAVVNALPTAFSVTGGGSYCVGGTGVNIGVSSSQSGVNYQLYRGATAVGSAVPGTTGPVSFGLQTVVGTYTVLATGTCSAAMSGSANVSVGPVPSVYSITGGGNYCLGSTGVLVGLSNSDVGVGYQLYNGASTVGGLVPGTGSPLSFGLQTATGSYSVVANPGSTCATGMTGSVPVVINPLPTAYTVTGGGGYCAGSSGTHVGLSFSNTGVNYNLYIGASLLSTTAGTGAALDFGFMTTPGSYSVSATVVSTGCSTGMSGSTTVNVNPLPTAFAMNGGGGYCTGGAGVAVGLVNSTSGISYQLYNGASTAGSPVTGTGSGISFGNQLAAGVYTVLATNTTTNCTNTMGGSATVVINALPTALTVTGGGAYCAGGAGVAVGMGSTQAGTSYQLYNGAATAGSAVVGTGGAISFGVFTASGTYSVLATSASSCTGAMSNSVAISINPLPLPFTVGGGGSYCAGGAGVVVNLSGSTSGINYYLYNGSTQVAGPVGGTGSGFAFASQTAAGTYSVLATNGTTGCSAGMTGTAGVSINSLPTAFNVTGGGTYCAGGTGVAINLSASQSSATYQLYNGASTVGAPVPGTGGGITFGNQTAAGTYSVLASNGCTNPMNGSVAITIYPLPTVYGVTGGGAYCSGGTGVAIGLGGSQSGINYQLYNAALPVGGAVAGTGASITFGNQTTAATYTIQAQNVTTLCTVNMSGTAGVTVNATPGAVSMTGGGAYCAGGAGVAVGLGGSATGISYQLYNGAATVGSPAPGTGSGISFGNQTAAGTYTVQAINNTTLCTANMTGTAVVVVNALPTVYAVTGGGNYCNGSTGVTIGLSGSSTGTNYQLYNGGSAVGGAVPGTGSPISFGTFTVAGTYSVLATNTPSNCTNAMSGTAVIGVNATPTVYAVGGGGTYCAGTGGVAVTLGNSQNGVSYQLYNGSTSTGSAVAGTGGSISFGSQTAAGTYSVLATNGGTGCSAGMSGTATVSVNAAPAVYTVSGGGSYCSGGTGVAIILSGSNTGINYQLQNGASPVGATVPGGGSSLNFGNQMAGGSYNVVATNPITNCSSTMNGGATVVVNPLPTVYNVTGGGSYCTGGAGVNVGLSGSALGISYQLYNGTSTSGTLVSGNGLPLDFGLKTSGGTYTVIAINPVTTCTANMGGAATVSVNATPIIHSVTGGGSYCAGGVGMPIGLGSSTSGISYQLYNGAGVAGSPVVGTGSSISFGSQTATGTYSVLATNTSTNCSSNMSGTTTISINPLPTVYTVNGGGTICNGAGGVPVGLSGSNSGINYQLYNGVSTVGGPVAGTGAGISFGNQNTAGTYSVVAINTSTGCVRNMSGTTVVNVNALPAAYGVTGTGSYCNGGTGLAVGLSNSQGGVSYQLYNGASMIGASVAGTGGSITFGSQTAAGTYTVQATNNTTGCVNNMSGAAVISINALPSIYNLGGGGAYCNGGAGRTVTLSGSNTGISYQLYNGVDPVGGPMAGTGGSLNFGAQQDAGIYMVTATNISTGCTSTMSGNPAIVVNALPTVYNITGGGPYCNGTGGIAVGLDGSDNGVNYQLYNGSAISGSTLPGNGGSISFGNQTAAGSYSVRATNSTTGCVNNMFGNTGVIVNQLPVVYTVGGGGNYCNGGLGMDITLSNSTVGIDYQLYNGVDPVGGVTSGTGTLLHFGNQMAAGTYSVLATNSGTGCTRNMTGTATININALPVAQSVTGGGSYCSGNAGLAVGLGSSQNGISYQLYNGATTVGSPLAGTGNAISFGNQAGAGTYTVLATNTTTGCTNAMSGNAMINVNTLPAVYTVIGMGSSYCQGDAGVDILLSGSDAGVSYQLYNGGTPTGTAVPGTGASIDMGMQQAAGVYMVIATNGNGCSKNMNGTAAVIVNALPAVYNITGGGNYCAGTAGATIGLSSSNNGISYQLYESGNPSGAAVMGNGGAISFGARTAGTYIAVATNTVTGCNTQMNGTASTSPSSLPSVFATNGGGAYCAGGAGMNVGLGGSATGISYQLYNGSTAVGMPVNGTGAAISFGNQTGAGTYTVLATNTASGCSVAMSSNAVITVKALPAVYNITGGGSYCAGGTAPSIGLGNTENNATYQLYNGTTSVGSGMNGTGAAISFGPQGDAGTYTIMSTSSTTGCSVTMSGTAVVTRNSLPTVQNVTGGGSYCSGGAGVSIGLNGSVAGTSYQLYNSVGAAGLPVAGTGAGIGFGMQMAAGSYSVLATNPSTGCSAMMNGTADVVVNTAVTPAVHIATGVGNTVCLGVLTTFSAGTTGGGTSPAYQWQVNGSNVGLGLSSYSYVPTNGDVVSVVMTSNAACATPAAASDAITMTVSAHEMPVAHVTVSPNDTVCAGTTVTYSVTPEFGGSTPVLRWMKNGVTVSMGTSYSYSPSNGDVITCELVSNFPCRLADTVRTTTKMVVESAQTPVVSISANPGTTIKPGQVVTLTASATGAGNRPGYQWKVNNVSITGATETAYTSANFANNDVVSVVVTSNTACESQTGSTSVVMKVTTGVSTTVGTLEGDIRLMPNPNNGAFIVKGILGTATDRELTIDVTDMLGQVVYHGKGIARGGVVNEQVQVINTLANGMYTLSLSSEGDRKVFHFIVQQ